MAGIYIHIPFCKSRCFYCDFHSGTDLTLKNKLVDAICEELKIRQNYLPNKAIKTIYIGGGTPSLLDENDFSKIFSHIKQFFDTNSCSEITLEANPDNLTVDYIKTVKKTGINRISIGVQSFNDKELKLLNRRHNSEKATLAVKKCQENGLENISIDLMYGLPSQTIESWTNSLKKAIELDIKHISAYHLTYEKGTKLHEQLKQGLVSEISEMDSISMFKLLVKTLVEAGFEHYEIANFAKPYYRSKHNSSYWSDEIYIGVGPSAHSYNLLSRQWNISDTEEYIAAITTNKPFFEQELLSEKDKYNDYIITRLRTKEGAEFEEIKAKFGEKMLQHCLENSKTWLAQKKLTIENNSLKLTKDGIFISDSIFFDLIF